jgi:protein-S-isoprenylcysteine O-methyltransferase Ste14
MVEDVAGTRVGMLVVRLVGSTVLTCVIVGLALFGAAGTVEWPAAWVFLVEVGLGSLAIGGWLAKADPALLAERLRPPVQRDQAAWDTVLLRGLLGGLIGWAALMGLDAVRFGLSHVPVELRAVGSLGPIACYAMTYCAFRVNSFASPVVKVDEARSQRLVDTGPYAIVRHPMYAGAIPFLIGTPLLLGSWIGLGLSPIAILILAIRAVGEEGLLRREMPEYAEYAARVPYRMVPAVW